MKSLITKYALSALTIAFVSSPLALAKKDGHPSEDAEAKLVSMILSQRTEAIDGIEVLYECKNITAEKGKYGVVSGPQTQKYLFSSVAKGLGMKMSTAEGGVSVEHFALVNNEKTGEEVYTITRSDIQDLKFYAKIFGGSIGIEMTVDKSKSKEIITSSTKDENGVEQKSSIIMNLAEGKDYPKPTLDTGNENEVVVSYILCTKLTSDKKESKE